MKRVIKRSRCICVEKTKGLISFAVTAKVTAKLICAFVFAYADCWFSHVAAVLCFGVVYLERDTK